MLGLNKPKAVGRVDAPALLIQNSDYPFLCSGVVIFST